jgi:hypothetical protein
MNKRADWNSLQHVEKLNILRQTALDQIVADYKPSDEDERSFRARIARETSLWQPQQAEATPVEAGAPPNKEVVLGAWRDLDRSEALRRAAALNGPTDLALTFVDYLNRKNEKARRYEQLDAQTKQFIEEVERVGAAPVSLISTRFDFRSIIDRRAW